MTPLDIGVSLAASSAADSGHLVFGAQTVYAGGAKSWWQWLLIIGGALAAVWIVSKFWKR